MKGDQVNSSRPQPETRIKTDPKNSVKVKVGHAFKVLHKKFEKFCSFCGYTWVARNVEVKQCPRCKRYFRIDNKGGVLK
jgi:rubrerythrin